jgi:hypothetical protein
MLGRANHCLMMCLMITEELPSHLRPLSLVEARLLRAKARRALSLTDLGRGYLTGIAVFFAIGLAIGLVLLASKSLNDAPWYAPLGVGVGWAAIGAVIGIWVGLEELWKRIGERRRLRSALRRDTAKVYEVHASAYVDFEEFSDEGALYAFQIDGHRIAFIQGQDFYASNRFPCLDFSLVHFLDEKGRDVEWVTEKRSPKAAPVRVIPRVIKKDLYIPYLHLCTLAGALDNLEELLSLPDPSHSK